MRLKNIRDFFYILLLTVLSSDFAHAYNINIQGKLTFTSFDTNGSIWDQTHRNFDITVQDCNWRITTTPDGDVKSAAIKLYEVINDGTNIYENDLFNQDYDKAESLQKFFRLNHIDTNATLKAASPAKRKQLEKMWRTQPSANKPINGGIGNTYPGNLPRYNPSLAAPLWLAYASCCYFEKPDSNAAPRMWEFDFSTQGVHHFMAKAQWDLSADSPHLPVRVVYFNTGTHFISDLKDPRHHNYAEVNYPAPYDAGFTNAIYEVISMTNTGGLALPLAFKLSRFDLVPGATNNGTLKLVSTLEGQASVIRLDTPAVSFVPVPQVNIQVQDYRFFKEGDSKLVQYLAKSNSPRSTADLKTLEAFQTQRRLEDHGKAETTRLSFIVMLALIFIFPVIAFLAMTRKQKKQTKLEKP